MGDEDIEREERAIYAIAIIALAPVVIVAVLRRAVFDGGTNLCLILVVLGAAGLLATYMRTTPPRLPRARVHTTRSREGVDAIWSRH